jgi:hypothetical protein
VMSVHPIWESLKVSCLIKSSGPPPVALWRNSGRDRMSLSAFDLGELILEGVGGLSHAARIETTTIG